VMSFTMGERPPETMSLKSHRDIGIGVADDGNLLMFESIGVLEISRTGDVLSDYVTLRRVRPASRRRIVRSIYKLRRRNF